MIPSVLAKQLQKGLCDYIKTTFPMSNHAFKGGLSNLLDEKNSVFREPYYAVQLPFKRGEEDITKFTAFEPEHKPHLHQQKAFERLTGEDGLSTLIATGTGSGKTECFLYPILEYCYRHRGESGIKALIIYPMNALASDQAERIAGLIYNSPNLRGNITAGMYVGGYEKNASRYMTEKRIITDKDTMLSKPPDILLTNYKMLDYLLLRPKDAMLWKDNTPITLKYIAVDELHTFDGAQGTDLACLLRRLKARLFTQQGYLCCIGTSATMGSKDNAEYIREYAAKVFGEHFEEDSVITEDRLSSSEFFASYEVEDFSFPTEEQCQKLQEIVNEGDTESYLSYAAYSWLDENFDKSHILSDDTRLKLSEQLMKHDFARQMIEAMAGNYVQEEYICKVLRDKNPEILKLSNPDVALDALFALISHGRTGEVGKLRTFLSVSVQFWIRELRRLLAKVSEDNIEYAIEADLNDNQAKHYLPIINCRDCGETGWVSICNERSNMTMTDLHTFYNLYFSYDSKIKMVFPYEDEVLSSELVPARLCTHCLQLDIGEGESECSSCGELSIKVAIPINNVVGKKEYKQYVCPFCGSRRGLSLMGLRSATAISAEISQLYSSKFNDDKKLLAFSDNVQDAAHRAGFFNYRTWKFGLRSEIQRFVQNEKTLSLRDFQDRFIEYLRKELSDEEFTGYFIPPNMTWMSAYERMKANGVLAKDNEGKRLLGNIEKRLKYEIMLELGMSSRIGRTLEKSGCSVLSFDREMIEAISERVKLRIINELGVLTKSPIEIFNQMVIGFLHIMRSNGGFNDRAFNSFVKENGDSFKLSNKITKWMPGVQSGRNVPRFIYKPKERAKRIWNFDTLTGNTKYIRWIDVCIDEFFIGEDIPELMGNIVLEELIKADIVVTISSSEEYTVYALDKSQVSVSTKVKQLICDKCGSEISVSEENKELWTDAPCLRRNCSGRLFEREEQGLDYYGKLYSTGDRVRVMAKEHTGLLTRNTREELENTFKKDYIDQKPWETNLISCTPTLEMGIDIGALSTIVLANMPPGQAQYLQRMGRAGRKDGNALTITVANARPHDLYFYGDPLEMIQGIVEPPKVFLNASAVLERQFTAYCMDSWVKRGVAEDAIPKYVRRCLNNLGKGDEKLFPFNFLLFTQSNLSNLIQSFIELFSRFDKGLDEDAIDELKVYAKGEGEKEHSMYYKVLDAFEELKNQKDTLQSNIDELKKIRDELSKKPKDSSYEEEIKEVKFELFALTNVMRNLKNKDVFNFMCDEGLLPNYAFPEGGIILKVVLFRKDEPEEEKEEIKKRRYEKMVFEYNRSASSAISEFAPANNFYGDGKKLKINQIDIRTADRAKWRLCPNCSYMEEDTSITAVAACPRCGSPEWSDGGQVRMMVKAKMVYSNMPYEEAQIDDGSDDRSSTFYCKQLLVDVDEDKYIEKAYRMDNDEFHFGYEFVTKASLREINFGEKDIHGERLTVSGVEDVRKGFKLCKYCGYIQDDESKIKHSFLCKAKNSNIDDDPYEECLFLYREFHTEILRILIPATTQDFSKTRQESFVAAFMLGMKKYFGNVDHLRAAICEVPAKEFDCRKQYLVVYDSVPGGTGYLKQLVQKDNAFIEILEMALEEILNCSCKDDEKKDGCYHCLFAYRISRNLGAISRKTAINILKQILSGKENLEKIENLSNIPVNKLLESELERNFITALEFMKNEDRQVKVDNILIGAKKGYFLKIGDCTWDIEPQVLLGEEDGVAAQTRVDFVFWPNKNSHSKKPVAVYTDGFTYHKDKCDDDTLKREAIRRSNGFRVWTFSWKDIRSVLINQGDYATETLLPENMPSGRDFYIPTVERGGGRKMLPSKLSPLEMFMRYLEMEDGEQVFETHARAVSLSLLNPSLLNSETAYDEWYKNVEEITEEAQLKEMDYHIGETFFGVWKPRDSYSHIEIFTGIKTDELSDKKSNALPFVYAMLKNSKKIRTDKYENDWNGFWHFYNLMQFSNNFAAVTGNGIKSGIYNILPKAFDSPIDDFHIPSEEMEWGKIDEELFEKEAIEFADRLKSYGVKVPTDTGVDVMDDKGEIIGHCEMVWEKEKVAALLSEQIGCKKVLEERGWVVFTITDDIPSVLKGGNR